MAVTVDKILDGERNAVFRLTGDGDAEAAVIKVDFSTLFSSKVFPLRDLRIMKIQGGVSGVVINLLWDATTDVLAETIGPDQDVDRDYYNIGGIPNNAGAGKTGDILLTTAGGVGSAYSLLLTLKKV